MKEAYTYRKKKRKTFSLYNKTKSIAEVIEGLGYSPRPGKQHIFGYQTENVLQKRLFMENFDTSIPSKYIQF